MSRLLIAPVLIVLMVSISCQTDPKVDSDPVSVFEFIWKDFDVSYPSFTVRKINWDSVYQVYRPQVTSATSDTQLFSIISTMLATLKDGHVSLTAPFKSYRYQVSQGKPVNFLGISKLPSLSNMISSRYLIAGILQGNIGYIYLPGWSGSTDDFKIIDQVVAAFNSVQGIIIDVRSNGGGNSLNADQVAGRFTDMKRIASYVRFKNGVAHDALGNFLESYIVPAGTSQITNVKIAVLINRKCFSSNEHFITAMGELPYVTIVGDTTGGGSANPVTKNLPNGWNYQIGQWIQYRANKETFEVKGIYPDVPVWISKSDSTAGIDTILATAVNIVK